MKIFSNVMKGTVVTILKFLRFWLCWIRGLEL